MSNCSLIPTFDQIPYNALIARIDNGSQGLFELTNLFNERKELEEKNVLHSAKVSRSNVYEYEINNSSCERVLGFFKNYHLFLSKAQVKHHKAFGEVIIKDLDDLKISRASNINKHKIAVQNCLRDVTNAEDALDKAKKNHLKARSDLERGKVKLVILEAAAVEFQRVTEEKRRENQGKDSNNKFSMGRMLSAFETTPEQERDKQQRKVDRRNSEVAACLAQIQERKCALAEKISQMDATLQKANVAFQESELERIGRLKQCMRSFCELERAAINSRSELLATLEEAIHSQSADEDLALFIAQERHVELTHKYTNAIGLMDLHVLKSEAAEASAALQSLAPEPADPLEEELLSGRDNVSISEAAVQELEGDQAADPSGPETDSSEPGVARGALSQKADELTDSVPSGAEARLVQRMQAALSALFPASSGTSPRGTADQSPTAVDANVTSVVEEGEWRELIFCRPARELFLQELDEQRGRRAALSRAHFASLTNAIKVLLDHCDAEEDAKSAMRAINMANTFHTLDETASSVSVPNEVPQAATEVDSRSAEVGGDSEGRLPDSASPDDGDQGSAASVRSAPRKRYLQAEAKLNGHPIWRKAGFWELALQEGILAQMDLNERTVWDELNPEALREAVIGVHNIVFGQLGTLSFAMHDLGLSAEEVERNVFQMSRRAQLAEDQEHELIRSVRIMYGKSVPPLPVPYSELEEQQQPSTITQAQTAALAGQSTPAPAHHHHPVVVVGKVIAVNAQSDRPPAPASSHHSLPPESGAALPPPLPPPLSPSHILSSASVHSDRVRTASFPSDAAAVPEGRRKSMPAPSEKEAAAPQPPQQRSSIKVVGSTPHDSASGGAPAESSFMSFFGRSSSSGSSAKQPQSASKAVPPKSGSTKAPPVRKPVGTHDDFFAVL